MFYEYTSLNQVDFPNSSIFSCASTTSNSYLASLGDRPGREAARPSPFAKWRYAGC